MLPRIHCMEKIHTHPIEFVKPEELRRGKTHFLHLLLLLCVAALDKLWFDPHT